MARRRPTGSHACWNDPAGTFGSTITLALDPAETCALADAVECRSLLLLPKDGGITVESSAVWRGVLAAVPLMLSIVEQIARSAKGDAGVDLTVDGAQFDEFLRSCAEDWRRPFGNSDVADILDGIRGRLRQDAQLDRSAGRPQWRAWWSALEPLRRALDGDGFVSQFEPLVDLRTGRMLGHALSLEICEPGGDCVPWATILAVAERFGLSTQLDGHLLERAVELAADGAAVALDISTASLVDPDLGRRVEQTVIVADVDPALLTFELSAEGIRSSPVAASSFVRRIRALGCTITVNKVGADVADLEFLKRLPVDGLKLDVGLTSGPPWAEADEHVVRAVVQFAHGLGMTVGAQGVSDVAAHRWLEDLGVDRGQGPLFGVPAALGVGPHGSDRAATGADHGG